MIELKESGVVFFDINHVYFLDGKRLQGITGMIKDQLFPDKYKGISKATLDAAADRGHHIHEICELYDREGFIATEPYVKGYMKLREPFTPVAQEYIVTDREHFASGIDLVWEQDGKIVLADIKSTSVLDEEYLSWQLSIYAYLFELQNPGLKVWKLLGLWIRPDVQKMVEIKRQSDEDVKELMRATIEGRQFIPLAAPEGHTLPAKYKDACEQILRYQQMEQEAKDKLKDLRAGLYDIMAECGVKKWEGYGIRLTRTDGTTRETFDKTAFFKDHPELSTDGYVKQSKTNGTVRITKI